MDGCWGVDRWVSGGGADGWVGGWVSGNGWRAIGQQRVAGVTVGTGALCRAAVGTDGQAGNGQPGAGGGLGAHAIHLCHRSWYRGAPSTLGWAQGDARGAKTPFWGIHRPGRFLPGAVRQPWGRLAGPRGLTFINISRSRRINTV